MSRVLISLAAAALCSSCTPVEGNGVVATLEFPLGTFFTNVKVDDQLSVNIARGEQKVTLTADENLIDRFEATVDGDTLTLRLKGPRDIQPTYAHVELGSQFLRGLEVKGASQVTAEATQAVDWRLTVTEGSTCVLTNLAAERFFLDVQGSSRVDVSGAAANVQIDVIGQANANTEEVIADDAKVEASISSIVSVRASRSIEIDSSGDSIIFVSGSPPARDIDADGGSQITFVGQ